MRCLIGSEKIFLISWDHSTLRHEIVGDIIRQGVDTAKKSINGGVNKVKWGWFFQIYYNRGIVNACVVNVHYTAQYNKNKFSSCLHQNNTDKPTYF